MLHQLTKHLILIGRKLNFVHTSEANLLLQDIWWGVIWLCVTELRSPGCMCEPFVMGLLHSPSLVAAGLPVGYETWPPIGWHLTFVSVWSKDRLGLPCVRMDCGLMSLVGISTILQKPLIVPCTTLMVGICLPLGLCKWTVKESTLLWQSLPAQTL